jgi:hypothetical protein
MTEVEATEQAEQIVTNLEAEGLECTDREKTVAMYTRFLLDEGAI